MGPTYSILIAYIQNLRRVPQQRTCQSFQNSAGMFFKILNRMGSSLLAEFGLNKHGVNCAWTTSEKYIFSPSKHMCVPQYACQFHSQWKKLPVLILIIYFFSLGQAPSDVESIIMELLRATVVLLGVSMFFSIITSVLTASEELRVNFPAGKHLDDLGKKSEKSLESGEIEVQEKLKDQEEKRIMNDVESGNINAVKDKNSTTMGASLAK